LISRHSGVVSTVHALGRVIFTLLQIRKKGTKMESGLFIILLFVVAVAIGANSAPVENEAAVVDEKSSIKQDQVESSLEQRLRSLEGELQRVKAHISNVDNLLEAWFLSAEQQAPSMIVTGPDANFLEGAEEKRATGGWAFMGSRGKRKQPFILGSRGKRSVDEFDSEEDLNEDHSNVDKIGGTDKRGAYFYGSRGKKQSAPSISLDEVVQRMPPYASKRYTFMGSRG